MTHELPDEDWTASWISPAEPAVPPPGQRPAYMLRGTFEVTGEVTRARLYATALGVYEAFLNGDRVGYIELAPGATSYADTLYAQLYDVTADLRPGTNTVEILLSDGWFRGMNGTWRKPGAWGDRTAARAELHLHHADGSTRIVRTGPDWTSQPSTITAADLMNGQTTDFTFVPPAPQPVLTDAVTAPPIDWSPAPPVRRIQDLHPVSVRLHASGSWIVDFGQNASGWLRLDDLGPAGTRTVIDHGEHLGPSGDLDTTHLDSARPGQAPLPFVQRDQVVSSGTPGEVFEPRHTVHGFRYARIERGDIPLDPASVVMRVVHTDLTPTATFTCGNDDVNRLAEIAARSFRSNAVDIPTDCPTRERLGWTGDYQVFAPTAARLFDVDGFSRKWLRSVRDDQLPDGRIVNASPDHARLKTIENPEADIITGSAGWGDAIVLVPWTLYETYGDDGVLAESFDAMVRWVEWALSKARDHHHPSRSERLPHHEFLWDGTFHWGEWCEPKQRAADGTLIDPVAGDPMAWFMADKGEVGTAYLHRSTSTLAATARVLGRTAEADRYTCLAEKIRDAWQTEFLDSRDRPQAFYVRALAFDLVPDHRRAQFADDLVALIRDAGFHLGTGFLSTADLLPVLADTGHGDIAYELLFQRSSPSWLGMLERGATTIWEDWDGIGADGTATASLNHYSKGAVVRFLHTHTLGLRQAPGSTAWERFIVAPVPDERIGWARGTFDSPHGTITVGWHYQDGEVLIDVDAPPGCTAEIIHPDGHGT
ncbi:alpha-L-rhamnosidase [Actinoplanes couchii]|uniref:alpha-L-rhamnosidase n=1 Tax=Actinoplanes couchii TaxID=403638 RepID=A0ABQ3XP24_9ACTN|nr:alpha-L-rhamnosidase [Actinoplanes couchii]MDR6318620.1 alpha-L-rhamnosidase [Actinoplanes couchii]GID60228.1 alpha-L-rhamnosidase [Actinoplanes couchii]